MNKAVQPKTKRKHLIGIVISDKSSKTRKVQIEQTFMHKLYKKQIRKKKNILVHDEKEQARAGDKVAVIESRPISKLKKWQLVKIVEKAK
ncbi:MAG: 30S ribosomal protein S17 [Spirochaetes bacterium]|nr:30S ribosomal protein S17 [Spirochaetota bacterium]